MIPDQCFRFWKHCLEPIDELDGTLIDALGSGSGALFLLGTGAVSLHNVNVQSILVMEHKGAVPKNEGTVASQFHWQAFPIQGSERETDATLIKSHMKEVYIHLCLSVQCAPNPQ